MTAMLLVSAPAASAMAWVRRGVVACHVLERHDWTIVVPVPGRRAAAEEPYDDAATVLLARPAGPRLAPSIGVGVLDERAVIVTQASGWRTVQRWAIRPRYGPVVRTPDLPTMRPADLAALAHVETSAVAAALADRELPAEDWLRHVLEACRLPGADVIRGGAELGAVVEPDERSRSAFAAIVRDETS